MELAGLELMGQKLTDAMEDKGTNSGCVVPIVHLDHPENAELTVGNEFFSSNFLKTCPYNWPILKLIEQFDSLVQDLPDEYLCHGVSN